MVVRAGASFSTNFVVSVVWFYQNTLNVVVGSCLS